MRILAETKRPSLSLISLPANWTSDLEAEGQVDKLEAGPAHNNNSGLLGGDNEPSLPPSNNSAQPSKAPTMTQPRPQPHIYHEKQVKALCALHALNNLFQADSFNQKEMDRICSELSPGAWLNPHKSLLGLGNYDINVIMTALQTKQYEAIWFDKRKDPSCLNFENIYGFILNIPTDCRVGWVSLPLKRKHWFSVRQFQDTYYNLDSKNDSPIRIGKEDDVIEYFREELRCREKELFLVVDQQVSSGGSWTKSEPGPNSSVITGLLPSSGTGNGRKESADSGVVELLDRDLDLNIVDLDKEEDGPRFT